VRETNHRDRAWFAEELTARGFRVLPSQTNFLLVDLGQDAVAFEKHLFERGVIVRPMGGYGLPHTVRVSIGSRAELQRLLENLP
jgi:histidinol-phosphate aminotransferase